MTAPLANYAPSDVYVSFLDGMLGGFAEGTFIEVEMSEDAFMSYVGSTGEVCHTRNHNLTAKITLTLMQTSRSNDYLSEIAEADRAFGDEYGPFSVKDGNGSTLCFSSECRIAKLPKVERGKESATVVWEFMAADMEIFAGGNIVT
jgi:hypothetical protein